MYLRNYTLRKTLLDKGLKRLLSEHPSTVNKLTLFRIGIFRVSHGWGGGAKRLPLPKICHTYPTMMKPGAVIPKEDPKNI